MKKLLIALLILFIGGISLAEEVPPKLVELSADKGQDITTTGIFLRPNNFITIQGGIAFVGEDNCIGFIGITLNLPNFKSKKK